jgi:cytochrome P450
MEAGGHSDIATPAGAGGLFAGVLQGQFVPAMLARIGASLASLTGGAFSLFGRVIAVRHSDVSEVLARDLDFLIAPVNAARIDAVNGPFVLGMDRGTQLAAQRRSLYAALAAVDKNRIRAEVARAADEAILRSGDGPLDVVGAYARPIAARTAVALFGIRGTDDVLFADVARAIFHHTFLNIGGDKRIETRALKAAGLMRVWFQHEIQRRRETGALGEDMMGALLRDPELDDDTVRRILGGMLVGSIDTTATAVAKIVRTLGRDQDLRTRMRSATGNPAEFAGWCREALRRWPHNPVLLRTAAADTKLGDVPVKAGATVVAWTQAAMRDPNVFPEPSRLMPDRPPAAYLHFGAGLHPCAGRSINEFQIPILVERLVTRGIENVGALKWAGPFPDHLDVHFQRGSA